MSDPGFRPPSAEVVARCPTVEVYVERELAATRAMVDRERAAAPRSLNAVTLPDRLVRAERYARWRHREFVAGRVRAL